MHLFRLVSPGGDTLGSVESPVPDWQPGDTVVAARNVQYRVVSVIPRERIAEVVAEPLSGVLEVEPIL